MEEIFKFLAGTGVAGAVLAFTMWKILPRLEAIERAIIRQSKVDLLRLASSPHVAIELKREAAAILSEIETEEKQTK